LLTITPSPLACFNFGACPFVPRFVPTRDWDAVNTRLIASACGWIYRCVTVIELWPLPPRFVFIGRAGLVPTCPISRRNIKGRPFWSRVLSVRLNPSRKDTLYD